MTSFLFLAGPSGSGKSHFAKTCLAAKHGWLHLEIDQHPKDGIDKNDLRSEWDEFDKRCKPVALHRELLKRAHSPRHVVLSFGSRQVFSPQHVKAAHRYFHIAYLYGHPAHCLQAFHDREQANCRGLKVDHWNSNNSETFGRLSGSLNHQLLIEAFSAEGVRRDPEKIYADILTIINDA
jgi:gluconate kinase